MPLLMRARWAKKRVCGTTCKSATHWVTSPRNLIKSATKRKGIGLVSSIPKFVVPRAGLEPAREQSPSAYVLNSTGCNPAYCHLAPHVGCKSHTLSHTLHLHPPLPVRASLPSPQKKPPIPERPSTFRLTPRSAVPATASARHHRPKVHRAVQEYRAGPECRSVVRHIALV